MERFKFSKYIETWKDFYYIICKCILRNKLKISSWCRIAIKLIVMNVVLSTQGKFISSFLIWIHWIWIKCEVHQYLNREISKIIYSRDEYKIIVKFDLFLNFFDEMSLSVAATRVCLIHSESSGPPVWHIFITLKFDGPRHLSTMLCWPYRTPLTPQMSLRCERTLESFTFVR